MWQYVKAGRWAVWFDADSTPDVSGTVPRPIALGSSTMTIVYGGNSGENQDTTHQGGNFTVGRMTTA